MDSAALNRIFQEAFQSHKQGDAQKALNKYQFILDVQPNHADTLHCFGVLKHQAGESEEAIKLISKAIKNNNKNGWYYNNIVDPYLIVGELKQAEKAARKAIQLMKNTSNPYNQLGLVYKKSNRLPQAISAFRKAISINPEDHSAHNNLGDSLRLTGELDKALTHLEKAAALMPDFQNAYTNLGLLHYDQLKIRESIKAFRKALLIRPDHVNAHFNLSLSLLVRGNFQDGWPEYEWRKQKFNKFHDVFEGTAWDGTDISGKTVLLYAEQGLGDTLQFVRFVLRLREKNVETVTLCQPAIHSLLSSIENIGKVIKMGSTLPHYDCYASLLSLPFLMSINEEEFSSESPYIKAPMIGPKLPQLGQGKKIGLVWGGNPNHANDHNRSIKLKKLVPFFQLPADEFSFYSLQFDERKKEIEKIKLRSDQLYDCTKNINDFSDTAYILKQLDMLITVDTSIAHLAGAMNIPCWLLVPYAPDWRWKLDDDKTSWYPSLKLYRQQKYGDWDDVVTRVKTDLESL